MSQFEDQLRTALLEAPTPATAIGDPLADLERRLGRARMRLGGIAVAVVIVLVAAIVVPLSLVGSSGGGTQPSLTGPSQAWPGPKADGVVSGDGSVWTYSSTTDPVRTYVQQRDPLTGAVEKQYGVPATQPTGIFFGAGNVWVANGGDGPPTSVTLAALDPTDGSIATAKLGQNNVVVTEMAFIGSEAYVLAAGQVYSVSRQPGVATMSVTTVHQHVNASWVLATPQPNPNTWIIAGSGGLEGVGAKTNGPDPLRYHYRRSWPPLASAGGADVWATSGKSLVLETFRPSGKAYPEVRFELTSHPTAVVVAANGDVYILEAGKAGRPSNLEAESSPSTSGAGTWQTAAPLQFNGFVTAIAADPRGGIVFQDSHGRLHHWSSVPAYEVGP